MLAQAESIAQSLGGSRSGGGYVCRCPLPSHGKRRGDRNPSLSISDGETALLVRCHGGCDTADVLAELRQRGLLTDGFNDVSRSRRSAPVLTMPSSTHLPLWLADSVQRRERPRYGSGTKLSRCPVRSSSASMI
jgi:hypothetical protein